MGFADLLDRLFGGQDRALLPSGEHGELAAGLIQAVRHGFSDLPGVVAEVGGAVVAEAEPQVLHFLPGDREAVFQQGTGAGMQPLDRRARHVEPLGDAHCVELFGFFAGHVGTGEDTQLGQEAAGGIPDLVDQTVSPGNPAKYLVFYLPETFRLPADLAGRRRLDRLGGRDDRFIEIGFQCGEDRQRNGGDAVIGLEAAWGALDGRSDRHVLVRHRDGGDGSVVGDQFGDRGAPLGLLLAQEAFPEHVHAADRLHQGTLPVISGFAKDGVFPDAGIEYVVQRDRLQRFGGRIDEAGRDPEPGTALGVEVDRALAVRRFGQPAERFQHIAETLVGFHVA